MGATFEEICADPAAFGATLWADGDIEGDSAVDVDEDLESLFMADDPEFGAASWCSSSTPQHTFTPSLEGDRRGDSPNHQEGLSSSNEVVGRHYGEFPMSFRDAFLSGSTSYHWSADMFFVEMSRYRVATQRVLESKFVTHMYTVRHGCVENGWFLHYEERRAVNEGGSRPCFKLGERVLLQGERGQHFGEIIAVEPCLREQSRLKNRMPCIEDDLTVLNHPRLKTSEIVREPWVNEYPKYMMICSRANHSHLAYAEQVRQEAVHCIDLAREIVARQGLTTMRFVDAEMLFNRNKLILFYVSDEFVAIRQLSKALCGSILCKILIWDCSGKGDLKPLKGPMENPPTPQGSLGPVSGGPASGGGWNVRPGGGEGAAGRQSTPHFAGQYGSWSQSDLQHQQQPTVLLAPSGQQQPVHFTAPR